MDDLTRMAHDAVGSMEQPEEYFMSTDEIVTSIMAKFNIPYEDVLKIILGIILLDEEKD